MKIEVSASEIKSEKKADDRGGPMARSVIILDDE